MTQAPTLSFWGGVGTIGGTRVLVQQAGHRVIFDFGLAFSPADSFYDGRVQPGADSVLREYLALGYAPPIPGLYRRELLGAAALAPGPDEPGGGTAVCISHLHLDHHGLTDLVAPGVPVYMHPDALRLARACRETGEQLAGAPRAYTAMPPGEPVAAGPLRVTPVPVDHDVPGSCGLLIETDGGVVAYTGDLRCHGNHPEQTAAFAAAARAARPVALLMEGTRLGESRGATGSVASEGEVAPRAAELVRSCPGLMVVNLYPRNVERVGALLAAFAAAGRTLALEAPAAHQFTAAGGSLGGGALYLTATERAELARGGEPGWLAKLVRSARAAGAPVVGAADVAGAQDCLAVQLSYGRLGQLAALRPGPGSLFLHTNGEPLGPFDPAFGNLLRWLQRFGLAHVALGCTGHAAPADLVRLAREIGPRVLVPIHSLRPELLDVPGVPRLLPEYGAMYTLDGLAGGRRY